MLPASFRAAPLAVQAFFVGNWVWMTATVGLLYQNAPQQLCVNYLIGTQLRAGQGLVAAAVAIRQCLVRLRGAGVSRYGAMMLSAGTA